ncbi:MAG: amidohydrolase [Desulfovibrionaceae bacterium]|jgi:5-methylthioadenosine/S-adenosylhomocysteine deaminase|nr:amidohydrolase [Desulfovibrionaceae bacterium]
MTASHCDTLVKCGVLVLQDEQRTVLRDAGLAVADGRVLAVGPWTKMRDVYGPDGDISGSSGAADSVGSPESAPHGPVAREAAAPGPKLLDLSGCLVLPGLVNAHTHAAMTLFRGLGDDLPLMRWLTERIWPLEKILTPELVHTGALLACCEMAATGTTCYADMYAFSRQSAAAARRVGLRAMPADGLLTSATLSYQGPEAGLELAETLIAEFRDDPLVRPVVMVHTVHTASAELIARSHELAVAADVPWMTHLAESRSEIERTRALYDGARPLDVLERLGALDERTVLVHGVRLTDAEIDRTARAGAAVVHNPVSNAKLANGMAPTARLLAAGVGVGLGTDGAASNNTLNMFKEMRMAAQTAKVRDLDPEAVSAQAALDMATLGGARCLRRPGLGTLAPGGAADLCALDLAAPGLVPLHSPVSNAVYAATGAEVRLTMVAGRVVYRADAFPHSPFPGVDYPALLEEVRAVRAFLLRRAGVVPTA